MLISPIRAFRAIRDDPKRSVPIFKLMRFRDLNVDLDFEVGQFSGVSFAERTSLKIRFDR
jgi:hypothetical protein